MSSLSYGRCFEVDADATADWVSRAPAGAEVPVLPTCDPSAWPATPFELTPAQGGLVAVAVAGVWIVGYGWRAVIRTLREQD